MAGAIYHCQIKNISRSGGRSAVAAAAYRAGEKLRDNETGRTHDYTAKNEVVYSSITLPDNAPDAYRDRAALWDAVELAETGSRARLAREFEIALPHALTLAQSVELVDEFTQALAMEGMCADASIHDKPGNRHAHIMTTTRQIDASGRWAALKERKTPALTRRGERVPVLDSGKLAAWADAHAGQAFDLERLDSSLDARGLTGEARGRARQAVLDRVQKTRTRAGRGVERLWKRETVLENPLNRRENVQRWRETWQNLTNRALERAGVAERVDCRSLAAQGIDREATVHEGYAAREIERRGGVSELCEQNREIRARNAEREAVTAARRQAEAVAAVTAAPSPASPELTAEQTGEELARIDRDYIAALNAAGDADIATLYRDIAAERVSQRERARKIADERDALARIERKLENPAPKFWQFDKKRERTEQAAEAERLRAQIAKRERFAKKSDDKIRKCESQINMIKTENADERERIIARATARAILVLKSCSTIPAFLSSSAIQHLPGVQKFLKQRREQMQKQEQKIIAAMTGKPAQTQARGATQMPQKQAQKTKIEQTERKIRNACDKLNGHAEKLKNAIKIVEREIAETKNPQKRAQLEIYRKRLIMRLQKIEKMIAAGKKINDEPESEKMSTSGKWQERAEKWLGRAETEIRTPPPRPQLARQGGGHGGR